ncbi:hypothetical protein IQ250_29245, partial [Pseudanabaenaceae cyanobacterium LEGE 13415]|nr:hypothetical protein [Pseudanabaenaceae cyanobacterium LEGE 13415]
MVKRGLGWVPDYPDIRDYRLEHEKIHLLNGEGDPIADYLALLNQLVDKIPSNQELKQELKTIATQAIQPDSTQKIKFQSASFDGSVLALSL